MKVDKLLNLIAWDTDIRIENNMEVFYEGTFNKAVYEQIDSNIKNKKINIIYCSNNYHNEESGILVINIK